MAQEEQEFKMIFFPLRGRRDGGRGRATAGAAWVGDTPSVAAVNVSAQPIFGRKIGRTCGIDYNSNQGVRVRGHFAEMAQVASQCNWGAPIPTSKYKTSPYDTDTDDDGIDDFWDPIPLDYDMDGDGYINHLDLITPGSSFYEERIHLAVQEYSANLLKGASGFTVDLDMDGDGIFDDDTEKEEDLDNDEMPDSYEIEQESNIYIYNRKYAINVGITKYRSPLIANLVKVVWGGEHYPPTSDAEKWADYLSSDYWECHLLLDGEAKRQDILGTIRNILSRASPINDQIIFTFSGHGDSGYASYETEEQKGKFYLCCHDGSASPSYDGWISNETFMSAWDSYTGKLFIFLSCCYGGGMGSDRELIDDYSNRLMVTSNPGSMETPLSTIDHDYTDLTYGFLVKGLVKGGSGTDILEDNYDWADDWMIGKTTINPVRIDGNEEEPFYINRW